MGFDEGRSGCSHCHHSNQYVLLRCGFALKYKSYRKKVGNGKHEQEIHPVILRNVSGAPGTKTEVATAPDHEYVKAFLERYHMDSLEQCTKEYAESRLPLLYAAYVKQKADEKALDAKVGKKQPQTNSVQSNGKQNGAK